MITISNNCFYFNIFLNVIYSSDGKVTFSTAMHPVYLIFVVLLNICDPLCENPAKVFFYVLFSA